MVTPHKVIAHPTKLQKAAYYLLALILFNIGLLFIIQGISHF
jgi:hypothetical protein